MDAPKIKKESKNKIRVDFERAPLWERFKGKFLSVRFLKDVIFVIFKIILLLGVSFVILYPYLSKIADSFKTYEDFIDVTVVYISRTPTLEQYKTILLENDYGMALLNSFWMSASMGLIQTLICALIAYGLAKFKFRGRNLIFALVIVTMLLPQETLQLPMKFFFWYFGETNIIGKLLTAFGLDVGLKDSFVPQYLLSLTGYGFRNGLFIFMLKQFFSGVPDELEESAYMDGSNTFRTFFNIILPISIPMLVTVFIFAFSWQWTEDFYINTIFAPGFWTTDEAIPLLNTPNFLGKIPTSIESVYPINSSLVGITVYKNAIGGTTTIFVALPLIIAFCFLQSKIVEGVERSGIVG